MEKTLVQNIGLLCTPLGSSVHAGEMQGQMGKTPEACVLMEDGIITYAGSQADFPMEKAQGAQVIDAKGSLVTPGLIDAHTHLVFGGWRQHEIPLKLAGAGYLDILRMGGGILSTVRHTREASEEELLQRSEGFLNEMLSMGVTSCEIKSGYGLDLENELKQLRVIKKLQETHPMDIDATFLGAHAVPEEYKNDPDGFVDLLVEKILPAVAEEKLARCCDVFCETGAFDVPQSRKVLMAGKALGLVPRIHADEIERRSGRPLRRAPDRLQRRGDAGHGQGRGYRRSAPRHLLLSGQNLCSGPAHGGTGYPGGHRFGFQPRLLPLSQPAFCHESGAAALQAEAGRGSVRRHPQRRLFGGNG